MPHHRMRLGWGVSTQILSRLEQNPFSVVSATVGMVQAANQTIWLVGSLDTIRAGAVEKAVFVTDPALPPAILEIEVADSVAVVVLGTGEQAGRVSGLVRYQGQLHHLESLEVAAPGLPRASILPVPLPPLADVYRQLAQERRFSRTIGALGMHTWRNLASLKLAIVGVGRLGSLLADNFAAAGICDFCLIDPDVVEEHTLGEGSLLTPAALGHPKAEAVAAALVLRHPTAQIEPVVASVLSTTAIQHLKVSDVIVVASDSPASRLGAALVAKINLLALLDVGTGILPQGDGHHQRRGGNARLVLPDGCLVCAGGGIADFDQAVGGLLDLRLPAPRDFRTQRAGSLRSLNATVAGLAAGMMEDLVAGAITAVALRKTIEHQPDGQSRLISTFGHPQSDCPICRTLTGSGDAGLDRAFEVVHSMLNTPR